MKLIPTLLFAVFILSACSGGGSGADAGEGPAQKAREVIISEFEMGRGNWLLTAKEADFFQDADSYVTMISPHLIFKVKGVDDSSIKSHNGRYDLDANLITMTHKVTGASKTQGVTFETEKLYYDTKSKLVWADTPVTITRGGVTTKGQGMKATSDFAEIEIFRQKTRLPPNIEELKAKSEVHL